MSSADNAVTRRALMQSAAIVVPMLAMPAIIGRAEAQVRCDTPLRGGEMLGSPDFGTRQRKDIIAGVRPVRAGGVRLDNEQRGPGKYIVHNYGHAGAGITLSWGCAANVENRIQRLFGNNGAPRAVMPGKSIGILGSGVCGLTVAHTLRASFPNTRLVIYSKDALRDTTSFKAGGQFAPAGMDSIYRGRLNELHTLMRASYAKIQEFRTKRTARAYGIVQRNNYSFTRHNSYDVGTPCEVVGNPRRGFLPFENLKAVCGWEYETYLQNPMIMLPALVAELRRSRRVRFERTMISPASLAALHRDRHDIIVNCTGYGSASLFGDPALKPVKGQLVILHNPNALKYMFSESCTVRDAEVSYLFCRQDDIVVGGTYEDNINNDLPVPTRCNLFRDQVQNIFQGSPQVCLRPDLPPSVVSRQCPSPDA